MSCTRFYSGIGALLLALPLWQGISCTAASSERDDFERLAPEGMMELPAEERAMAVIASFFGGGATPGEGTGDEDGFAALDLLLGTAHADLPYNMCTDDPVVPFIANSLQGASGSYGSGTQPVAVDSDQHFCQDSAGNSMPNTNNTQYKSWAAAGIVLTCSWGEVYNFSGSGIVRHTALTEIDVHGAVGLTGGPGAGNYDCTFFAHSIPSTSELNDTIHSGSCTDALGNAWTEFAQVNAGGYCTATLGNTQVAPPTAVCGESGQAFALDTVSFDGSGSIDPYGRPLSYTWQLYTPDGSSASLDSLTSPTPSTMLDLVGSYEAELTVTTVDGATDSCTQTWEAISYENFRIEMWWDHPDDMDLHLLRANPAGSPRTSGDCYYGNCNTSNPWMTPPDWGVPGFTPDNPGLDLDDIWGDGPENINIENPALAPYNGWYRVFVHDYPYTARYYGSNGVHINIYLNGDIVRSYDFSISGEDADYYVAKIQWPGGTIVDCNGLSGCP